MTSLARHVHDLRLLHRECSQANCRQYKYKQRSYYDVVIDGNDKDLPHGQEVENDDENKRPWNC